MKQISFIALGCTLALAGCNTTGSVDTTAGGPGPGPGLKSFMPVNGGLGATAEIGPAGNITVSKADPSSINRASADENGNVSVALSGGAFNGRTFTFAGDTKNGIYEGDAKSGLQGDETEGFLTALDPEGKASVAAVLSVNHGGFDDTGDSTDIALLHGSNPNYSGTNTLPDGSPTLSYSGRVVGVGKNATVAGDVTGAAGITANFADGSVTGTMSGLQISNEDSGESAGMADVGFSGTMSSNKASYSGTDVSIGGASATGSVSGGFYGNEAAETAGAIFANDGTNALGGVYQADKN